MNDTINCRTCSVKKFKNFGIKISNKCHLNQTIKDAILQLVPELSERISDSDYVCKMCLKTLRFCMRFIEKCKKAQSKLDIEKVVDEDLYRDSGSTEEATVDQIEDGRSNENDEIIKQLLQNTDNEKGEDKSVYDLGKNSKLPPDEILEIDVNNRIIEKFTLVLNKDNVTDANINITNITQLENKTEPIFDIDHDYPQEIQSKYITHVDEVQDVDFTDHDKVVSLKQPNGLIVPEFLTTLQDGGVKILQYSFSNASTPKKILLLGTTLYKKCTECEKTFSSQPSLKKHLRIVHNHVIQKQRIPKRCTCPKCGRGLNKSHLESHLKLCQTKACPYCQKPIGKGFMNKHLSDVHKVDKPFKCDKCGKAFRMAVHLKLHVNHCQTVQCLHCKELVVKRQYANHLLMAHDDSKPYKCSSCDREFKRRANYRIHLEGHRGFPCDVCKKVFKIKISLVKHQQKFSNGRCDLALQRPKGFFARTKICYTCGEEFTNKKDFAKHKTIHTTAMCEICGKCFSNAMALSNHKPSHNPDNTEICHACGKGYKHKGSLRHHLLSHYSSKKLACDRCPKKFHFKNGLLSHIKREHDKIRDIPCQGCNMMFCTSDKMRLHYRTIHLRLRPYKCDVCERTFARSEHLNLHKKKVHDKEKNKSGASSSSPKKKRKTNNGESGIKTTGTELFTLT